MNNLMIIIWPYQKSSKWYRTLASKLICFFTNSNYTHAAVAVNGWIYESTVMNSQHGAIKTKWKPKFSTSRIYLQFKKPLSKKETDLLAYNLNRKVVEKRPYNFLKIAVLMLVYPTRKLWNKIGWVPFQNEVFGYVCSTFVDEALKEIGVDLIPKHDEEYTAPGDFLKSKLLEPMR